MATKNSKKASTRTSTKRSAPKRAPAKRSRPAQPKKNALPRVEPNPDPGPMPTNESLNPDSRDGVLKAKHLFRAGEEVAFWPASLVGQRQLEGLEPMRTPFASATVREDGTIDVTGLGHGKWIMGGPAGYPVEDRFHKVTVKK